MYCNKCGKYIDDDSNFCPKCGAKLDDEVKNETAIQNDENSEENNVPLFTAYKSLWVKSRDIVGTSFLALLFLALSVIGVVKSDKIIFFYVPFFAAILTILVLVGVILEAKHHTITFYKNIVIEKKGFFSTKEKMSGLTKVLGVSVNQSFKGKLFNYGDITIDKVGQWDIDFHFIKKPYGLKNYLETLLHNTDYTTVNQLMDD